jgi:hypothetical protein
MGRSEFQKYLKMRDDILENFDFKKCEIAMQFLNWTWGFQEMNPRVEDLKKTANYLLESAAKGCLESRECKPYQTYFSSTGGLKATTMKDKYGNLIHLHLEFLLTDWGSDGDT